MQIEYSFCVVAKAERKNASPLSCRRKSLPSLSFNLSSTSGRVQARAQQWPCLSMPVAKVSPRQGSCSRRSRPSSPPSDGHARVHPCNRGSLAATPTHTRAQRPWRLPRPELTPSLSGCAPSHGCSRPHPPLRWRALLQWCSVSKAFLRSCVAVGEASFWVGQSFTVRDPDDRIGLVFG